MNRFKVGDKVKFITTTESATFFNKPLGIHKILKVNSLREDNSEYRVLESDGSNWWYVRENELELVVEPNTKYLVKDIPREEVDELATDGWRKAIGKVITTVDGEEGEFDVVNTYEYPFENIPVRALEKVNKMVTKKEMQEKIEELEEQVEELEERVEELENEVEELEEQVEELEDNKNYDIEDIYNYYVLWDYELMPIEDSDCSFKKEYAHELVRDKIGGETYNNSTMDDDLFIYNTSKDHKEIIVRKPKK